MTAPNRRADTATLLRGMESRLKALEEPGGSASFPKVTIGGVTLEANATTPYAALQITNGDKGIYSGIRFADEAITLMVDSGGAIGFYTDAGVWRWYFDAGGVLQAGTVPASRVTGGAVITDRLATGYDNGAAGSVSASNWFRSSGATGWYNDSYAVGIYATDGSWVRTYPYTAGVGFATAGSVSVGGNYAQSGSTISFGAGNVVMTWAANANGSSIATAYNVALYFGANANIRAVDNAHTVWRSMLALSFAVQSNRDSKERIRPTAYGLEDLLRLKVVDYKYRKEADANEPHSTGLIAEDTMEVYPPAVINEDIMGIDYGKMSPLIISALQEFVKETRTAIKELKGAA